MKQIGVRELAKLANVSLGTVDRALHGRKEVNEQTRRRILEIAAKNGYVPNLAARALSARRTTILIGVCIPREIHYFYDQMYDGIVDEARRFEHAGVEVLYRPVKTLGSKCAKTVSKLLDEGIKALILVPGDPVEAASIIEIAEKKKDVRVICLATDDSLSCRSSSISVEPGLNGRLAADLMTKFVQPGAQVAVVTGMVATEDNGKKVNGFSEVFQSDCPTGQIVEVIEGHEDEVETFEKCVAMLRKYPRLSGIYVSTVNCIPVCKAIRKARPDGGVKVVATDLFSEAVPYFENGTLAASIYQNPYRQGQSAVRLIVDHALHGKALPSTLYLNPAIVMRANLGLFRELQRQPRQSARNKQSGQPTAAAARFSD